MDTWYESIEFVKSNTTTLKKQVTELIQFKNFMEKTINQNTSYSPEEVSLKVSLLKNIQINPIHVKIDSNIRTQDGQLGVICFGKYDGNQVAIKRLKYNDEKNQKFIESIENELLILKALDSHPNIIHCYGYYREEIFNNINIVLELAPYRSLKNIVFNKENFPSIPFKFILSWLKDLASAIRFAHRKGIKHKDIRIENLLIFKDLRVKLSNFGLSKQVSSMKTLSKPTPTMFLGPEIIEQGGSTLASDIFAFAMTFCQMISRQELIVTNKQSIYEDQTYHVNQAVNNVPKNVKENLKTLLTQCITNEQEKRPPAERVFQEIEYIEKIYPQNAENIESPELGLESIAEKINYEFFHPIIVRI